MQRVKFLILTLVSVFTIGFSSMSAFAMPTPVNPSGFTPQVIAGGSGSMTPQTLSNSIFFGLGLTSPTSGTDPLGILTDPISDDEYFSSVKDALNSKVPGLGVTYVDFIKAYTSGLTTIWKNSITLPANLWNQLKSATSNGLEFTTHVPGPSFNSAYDMFEYFFNLGYPGQFDEKFTTFYNAWIASGKPEIYFFLAHMWDYEPFKRIFMAFNVTYQIDNTNNYLKLTQSGSNNASVLYYIKEDRGGHIIDGNDALHYASFFNSSSTYGSIRVSDSFSSGGYDTTTSLNQDPDVAALLQNDSYGLVSKGSTYENDVFQEGDIIIQPVDNETLKSLVTQVNNDALPLPDALQNFGVMPVDTSTGTMLNQDIDISTAQDIVQNHDQLLPSDSIINDILPTLDDFVYVTPHDLDGVMNWLATQMQMVFSITEMQSVFLVTSTLLVVALLLGLVRLWR